MRETYSGARLVDPSWSAAAGGGMSAEELKRSRGADDFVETPAERATRLRQEQMERQREHQIAEGIRRREQVIKQQFDRIHGLIDNAPSR